MSLTEWPQIVATDRVNQMVYNTMCLKSKLFWFPRTKLDIVAVLWAANRFPRGSANLSLGNRSMKDFLTGSVSQSAESVFISHGVEASLGACPQALSHKERFLRKLINRNFTGEKYAKYDQYMGSLSQFDAGLLWELWRSYQYDMYTTGLRNGGLSEPKREEPIIQLAGEDQMVQELALMRAKTMSASGNSSSAGSPSAGSSSDPSAGGDRQIQMEEAVSSWRQPAPGRLSRRHQSRDNGGDFQRSRTPPSTIWCRWTRSALLMCTILDPSVPSVPTCGCVLGCIDTQSSPACMSV
ncbi:hypothetical protein C8Q76DRAFT_689273 [Earliella scabrosa]|nr:hypothetical protein C8Q76DRAFT_689273 [Earliella scabrosa]